MNSTLKPIILFLTCANKAEAKTITDALLEARLIACVKWQTVTSHFLWQGARESAEEILLMMETVEGQYDAIHAHVKQLHSYQTFVLIGVPITKISDEVRAWLNAELQG